MANPGTDSPLWINASPSGAPSYTAGELRQAMALAFTHGITATRPLGARAGLRPGAPTAVVTYANPTITVKACTALIYDTSWASTRGPYWAALPADETFTATAADGTNPRKDILVLRVYDHDEDSSGQRLFRSEYIVGTPAGSPSEPGVPAGSIKLAVLSVPNTGGGGLGSASLTMTAPYTTALGGILPVRDSTDEGTLTGKYEGLAWYRLDEVGGSALRIYDGSVSDYIRGVIICTSSTRPAHREGRVIYETDTDRHLTSDGSAWQRQSHVSSSGRTGVTLRRTTNQTIPNSTQTDISWNVEDQDTDGFISVPSTTITIPSGLGGMYMFTYRASGSVIDDTARHFLSIALITSIASMPVYHRLPMWAFEDLGEISVMLELAAGDTINCNVFQSGGSSQTFTAWLSMYRVMI